MFCFPDAFRCVWELVRARLYGQDVSIGTECGCVVVPVGGVLFFRIKFLPKSDNLSVSLHF